jgi:hypothetical protein
MLTSQWAYKGQTQIPSATIFNSKAAGALLLNFIIYPGGKNNKTTVTIEQCALIKHCLWMTKMVTNSKIVDPLNILHQNMQF